MQKELALGLTILLLVGAGLAFILSSPAPQNISKSGAGGEPYREIVSPSGFVNTGDKPIKIADYAGKQVILLDVMTYSCINCQRTFPYVTGWYEKYKDEGLIVIGIHTPEFAFEKDKKNVESAMREFSINFPVVLDNDYGTWNAYGKRYWPRKYLIDIFGNVVYDHIGEGAYEETEMKIQELLAERKEVLGEAGEVDANLVSGSIKEVNVESRSPETYFGSLRNEYLGNGLAGISGEQNLGAPKNLNANTLYLVGEWNITPEYAEAGAGAKIIYKYIAKDVYLVADADTEAEIEVWLDGRLVGSVRGSDVSGKGILKIKESRLYKIIEGGALGEHTLELRIKGDPLRAYAFTFG